MRWFTTDPCYVFHPMNAWEEGETIFADVMEYPVAPLFPNADGSMPARASARLVRWTFDLVAPSNTIRREPLDDLAGRISALRRAARGLALPPRLVRRTIRRPAARSIRLHRPCRPRDRKAHDVAVRRGRRSGRACFCAALRADAPEGDGWILTLVYRGAEDRSDLVVFDAGAIETGPIGVARLPRRVPFGFHGNWRPA